MLSRGGIRSRVLPHDHVINVTLAFPGIAVVERSRREWTALAAMTGLIRGCVRNRQRPVDDEGAERIHTLPDLRILRPGWCAPCFRTYLCM